MSELHIRHIEQHILARFAQHVDLADVADRPDDERQVLLRSRCLAALALAHVASLSDSLAAAAVVDGFDDHGLDAIHHSPSDACFYVIQAKWSAVGKASVTQADAVKLVDGLRDLMNARLDRFNDRIRSKRTEIEAALDNPRCRFHLVLAYIGTQPLAIHARRPIDDMLTEYNDVSEILYLETLAERDLHRAVLASTSAAPIDLDVVLHHWGHVQDPYRAWYGQAECSEIAGWWNVHGNALFSKNIRKFLRDTHINIQIGETLRGHPDLFWYYNNGITLLAQDVKKKPFGGASRATGVFVCSGATIVNGAQTVGAIGRAFGDGSESDTLPARVSVRLISLEGCPPGFAELVTTATNTQNRIEPRDFASLDPEQERLAAELRLEGVPYAFKAGDDTPVGEGFTIEDATIALACSHQDLRFAVLAKGNLGRFWENTQSPLYRALFHAGVSGAGLREKVQVMLAVQAQLESLRDRETGLMRQILIHANRFLLRQVFRARRANPQLAFSPGLEPFLLGISAEVHEILERTQPGSYLAWVFKNYTRCLTLEQSLIINGVADYEPRYVERGRMWKNGTAPGQQELFSAVTLRK